MTQKPHASVRVVLLVLALLVHSQISAKDGHDTRRMKITDFLRTYFIAAREYAVSDMIEMVSREVLEEDLKAILLPGPDNAVLRSVKTVLNTEFIFAGNCKIHIHEISSENRYSIASILIERPDYANHYDFYLVEEAGKLRINHKVFKRRMDIPSGYPDIDVCDVPINWNNPSILKPDEEPEEQRRRLGIPSVGARNEER